MPETPKSKDKEAFNAFVAKYNLDPLNNNAIMNCLFEQEQQLIKLHEFVLAWFEERVQKLESQ